MTIKKQFSKALKKKRRSSRNSMVGKNVQIFYIKPYSYVSVVTNTQHGFKAALNNKPVEYIEISSSTKKMLITL